tara:strand:- start:461 stop:1219 length:759 start_codon:yes stop_codon:yes gene_type:complete
MLIYGINPVSEALRAGTVSELFVSARHDRRLEKLLNIARRAGVDIRQIERSELDGFAQGGVHQGVVARIGKLREYAIDDLVREAAGPALILMVDGVEDPQNFGALIRTADAAGFDGVVYQTRRSSPTSSAAMKSSAGAMTHVRLAPVVNIARTIDELKSQGVWSVGLVADEGRSYFEIDWSQPTVIVVGAEGSGLRRLVRQRCDWLVSIPMHGEVSSLNVSVAAGIVAYEALRQRLSMNVSLNPKTDRNFAK